MLIKIGFVFLFMTITIGQSFANPETMTSRAKDVLASLTDEQLNKAQHPFNSDKKKFWRYFPSSKLPIIFPEHTGLKVSTLNEEQQAKVLDLVETVMSDKGLSTVKLIRHQDSDPKIKRKVLEKTFFKYGKENYFITFFGTPADARWMWRFEGHHVSININMENGVMVSAAPFFLGINPTAYFYDGSIVNTHDEVIASIRPLVASLNEAQLKVAAQKICKLPKDLLFTPSLGGKLQLPEQVTGGISYQTFTPEQQQLLLKALSDYLLNLDEAAHAVTMAKVIAAGLHNLEFEFIGNQSMKGLYYWRVHNPAFVFEFMTADKNDKHYHVAWQEFK